MNVLTLARRLLSFDTVSPSLGERACLDVLADILSTAGFHVRFDEYAPGRVSLSARLRPDCDAPALCLAGHIDTVPLGGMPWSVDPFAGEIRDGLLYGRGASDMKGGVAAYVCAAVATAPFIGPGQDLVVHVYGGEETGCEGSFHLMRDASLRGNPGAVVVAEPTSNRPLVGHKGALWLRGETRGRTAHGSMPEQGKNALLTCLQALERILAYDLGQIVHPFLGQPTLTPTTLHSGLNINSVPDSAVFTLDVRTVPGLDHACLTAEIKRLAGEAVALETMLNVSPVWTAPDNPWIARVRNMWTARYGLRSEVETVQFFTDAAALRVALPDTPILILGPGDPAMAHRTDEFCPVHELEGAVACYLDIIADWNGIDRALLKEVPA